MVFLPVSFRELRSWSTQKVFGFYFVSGNLNFSCIYMGALMQKHWKFMRQLFLQTAPCNWGFSLLSPLASCFRRDACILDAACIRIGAGSSAVDLTKFRWLDVILWTQVRVNPSVSGQPNLYFLLVRAVSSSEFWSSLEGGSFEGSHRNIYLVKKS